MVATALLGNTTTLENVLIRANVLVTIQTFGILTELFVQVNANNGKTIKDFLNGLFAKAALDVTRFKI